MYDLMENNAIKALSGKVLTNPEFYHEAYDEKFYTFNLEVSRLSDNVDVIPVLISKKILNDLKAEDYITITGQIRTYNKYEDDKRKLLLFVFVRDYTKLTFDEFVAIDNPNEVTLKGFVCKQPIYRKTPMGREITDLLIAVNRAYRKSDYIPAIAWGRNAKFCENLAIGTKVEISGRIQSRGYTKKLEDGSELNKTAYEVSINRIKLAEETATEETTTEE